jgi:AraC family transcriptional regulator
MRAASATSPAGTTGGDDVLALHVPSAADPSPSSLASPSERAEHLVRRALQFLANDYEAARRCLNEASALLASQSQNVRLSATVTHRPFSSRGLTRWQTRRVLAHIEANIGNKIQPLELAALVAFSKSHFSRAFKRTVGLAPMEYVVNRRVERAKIMMTSTREPLSQIALACGFADQPHLTRSFHRQVGMSPALWRRIAAERTEAKPPPNESEVRAPLILLRRNISGNGTAIGVRAQSALESSP